jgi:prevent-host-death family protein
LVIINVVATTKGKPPISAAKKEHARSKRELGGRRENLKKSYALGQAKAHLSEIVDHVEATGEEIVVTRHGKPVARLVPDRDEGPRPLGFARGRVKFNKGWDQPLTFEELFGD